MCNQRDKLLFVEVMVEMMVRVIYDGSGGWWN